MATSGFTLGSRRTALVAALAASLLGACGGGGSNVWRERQDFGVDSWVKEVFNDDIKK